MIAALWDDLTPANGQVKRKPVDVDGDQINDLVIQWTDYAYVDDEDDLDPITFQAVLFANGNIQFNYIDLDSLPANDADGTINETGGVSATVGVWRGAADKIEIGANKFVPGLHSIGGSQFLFADNSNTPTRSVDTNDSYVRLAWDTGGAAWDIGVIDAFSSDGGREQH